MISKVKDLMAVSEKLNSVSSDVQNVSKDVSEHSKLIASFREEVTALTGDVKANATESARFCSSVAEQIDEIRKAREDLKKEVYDFKLIKADIQSRLVQDLTDDFRNQLKEETRKLDTDVKHFNELKTELSGLVQGFKSVEGEIAKFKSIAQEIKKADFELARHARELTQADAEKLKLMQRIDQLERLVSKMRRGR